MFDRLWRISVDRHWSAWRRMANPRRLGMTLVVACLFGYFAYFGPWTRTIDLTGITTPATEDARPRFVSLTPSDELAHSGLVAATDEFAHYRRYRFGLAELNPAAPPPAWGLVGETHYRPAMALAVGQAMLAHARELTGAGKDLRLRQARTMFYVEVWDGGELTALYLESAGGLTHDIQGYAGPLVMGVLVDPAGHLREVYHIDSRETASFLADIKQAGYYLQFRDLPLDHEQYIDALSGATLSTQAMARTVTALIDIGEDSPLADYLERDARPFVVTAQLTPWWWLHTLVLTGLFLLAWQRRRWPRRYFTIALGLVSIGTLGLYLNQSFTYVTFLQPWLGVSLSTFMAIYAALVLLSAIWDENTYCRHLCPYGQLQRLGNRWLPTRYRRRLGLPSRWLKRLRLGLTLVLIGGILLGLRRWSGYELYPDLFGLDYGQVFLPPSPSPSFWFWLALGILLASLIWPLLWCRVLCPTGAVLDGIRDLAKPRRPVRSTTTDTTTVTITDTDTHNHRLSTDWRLR